MNSEVLGGAARVEPLVDSVGLRAYQASRELVGDQISQLAEQLVKNGGACDSMVAPRV